MTHSILLISYYVIFTQTYGATFGRKSGDDDIKIKANNTRKIAQPPDQSMAMFLDDAWNVGEIISKMQSKREGRHRKNYITYIFILFFINALFFYFS